MPARKPSGRLGRYCIRSSRVFTSAVPGGDQLGHRAADVGVQVVPDDHERPVELLVRGVQEPGVIGLGETLAPIAASRSAWVSTSGPVSTYLAPAWPSSVSARTATEAMSRSSISARPAAPNGHRTTSPERIWSAHISVLAANPASIDIRGLGFFDKEHNVTGAAPNDIELHPVIYIKFL